MVEPSRHHPVPALSMQHGRPGALRGGALRVGQGRGGQGVAQGLAPLLAQALRVMFVPTIIMAFTANTLQNIAVRATPTLTLS